MPSVTLITHTPEPEKIVAAAAKLCYSDAPVNDLMSGLTPEKTAELVNMLAKLGHESPLEHAVFTFSVEGVSRSMMAQITRHRIASFSVKSQRYVAENSFGRVTPPSIEGNGAALEVFEESMRQAQNAYAEIAGLLEAQYLRELAQAGDDSPQAARDAKKRAIEDARFVLPNSCETKLMTTMNARSLRNFFSLRCCGRAQWEIRSVAEQMLRLCRQVAPSLFTGAGPPCLRGPCPEGAMSCGRAQELRRQYNTEEGS